MCLLQIFTVTLIDENQLFFQRDADEAGDDPYVAALSCELPDGTPTQNVPHWRAQPYLRGPPPRPSAKKAAALASVPRMSGPGIARPPADDKALSQSRCPLEVRKRAAECASDDEEGSKRAKR
jgi:hypothetical protein